MIGRTVSHYTILEELGRGGMGVVYKARDTRLDRVVALKFLPTPIVSSDEEALRFEQEAKAISALNDPHIAIIHDIEDSGDQRFLVLEYLPGGTLKERMKDLQAAGRELPVSEVINYGLQIAEGLAHAHRHGIVHRDIKTDNIMLTEDGKAKITDFGLAKLRGGLALTRSGSTLGTAAFMSPEQIRGDALDARSDLFSLGVVLYELALGVLPFRGEHDAALTYSIVNEEPVAPRKLRPALPAQLDALIRRCLEKDPAKRFQSAEDIVAQLRQFREGTAARPVAPSRRRYLPWVAAATGLAIVVTGLLILLPGRSVSVERKSIAVLPFTNLSGNQEDEYFSDGMTEDIIAQLSKIGDLKVISPASVMQYKGVKRSTRDIAKDLNVATVLEGSIRRGGGQVHITAHLIDASTDEHLWAETYDEDMAQIFRIQSDVAQKIAGALQARLSNAERERIQKKPTESLNAYAKYLEGREYYMRYHKQDNENAIRLFKSALDADPNYALAYAGLGDAYGQRVQKFGYPFAWIDSSIAMGFRAISADPTLAEGYKALALGFGEKGWYHKALETNRKAIELNPNFYPAIQNVGWGYWLMGRFDEALPWMKKSLSLNPTFAYSTFAVGTVYLSLYDSVNARQLFNKIIEQQPDFTYSHLGLALVCFIQRDYGRAMQHAQWILANAPDDLIALNLAGDITLMQRNLADAERFYAKAVSVAPGVEVFFLFRRHETRLGYVLYQRGQRDAAERLFTRSLALDRVQLEQGNESHLADYDMACIDAVRGDRETAYTWLQKAIDAGWRDYLFGSVDPLLENLRADTRFGPMMDQVRASVDGMRQKVNNTAASMERAEGN